MRKNAIALAAMAVRRGTQTFIGPATPNHGALLLFITTGEEVGEEGITVNVDFGDPLNEGWTFQSGCYAGEGAIGQPALTKLYIVPLPTRWRVRVQPTDPTALLTYALTAELLP